MSEEVKLPLPGSLQEIIGSLLFASEVPLTAFELHEAVRAVEPEEGENKEVMDVYRTCTSKEIEAALRGLERSAPKAARPVHLQHRPDVAPATRHGLKPIGSASADEPEP